MYFMHENDYVFFGIDKLLENETFFQNNISRITHVIDNDYEKIDSFENKIRNDGIKHIKFIWNFWNLSLTDAFDRWSSISVITFGTFDLFHDGHYNILKRASLLGKTLVVGISSDSFNMKKKTENADTIIKNTCENIK